MERPNPAKHWYVLWDGKSVGPWSTETVVEHLNQRKLNGTDRVLAEGETEWCELREDPFFSRHIKRRPRRKEKLRVPRPVRELVQERKKSIRRPAAKVSEQVATPVKSRIRLPLWPLLAPFLAAAFLLLFSSRKAETPAEMEPQKMRSSEDTQHLPNPPGPATTAPVESDPISLPTPPTRPVRP